MHPLVPREDAMKHLIDAKMCSKAASQLARQPQVYLQHVCVDEMVKVHKPQD